MSDDERLAIRRYYFDADECAQIAALPEAEQSVIDTRLAGTFGAERVRLHLATTALWRELTRPLPRWLRRWLAKEGRDDRP